LTKKNVETPDYVRHIRKSNYSIYDLIEVGHPKLWIPTEHLEKMIRGGLIGLDLTGLPIRTRSKTVKTKICEVLGYPVPNSFRRSQPRFPGQAFDTYVQKSNNLQIWNEAIAANRRYVLIRVSSEFSVTDVRVISGNDLAILDRTGTLTQKYQARFDATKLRAELVSKQDTRNIRPLLSKTLNISLRGLSPIETPIEGSIFPIAEVFILLKDLVGVAFVDAGHDQERNRGAGLHKLVCSALGFEDFADDGRFPDVLNQLIEIKLQTAPTIDLGLVLPNSQEPLDIVQSTDYQIRNCDVRYAVFGASTDGELVTITNLVLVTGEDFFARFKQFKGVGLNQKIQIPLRRGFFPTESK
jgi:hypothetical protein